MRMTFWQFWNNVIMTMVIAAVIGALTLVGKVATSEHQIQRYYVESRSTGSNNGDHELVIVSDREWSLDGEIILDRDITYDMAIDLVEKLNKKLVRKHK